ncbi:MAG: Anthranilate phosphoribosyltransferase [Cenarchaeum symbiont of Oopsacas minuta]|nr:Anthranilate phosphoribosyltransferase [Cenarchaeum symbiont of Oopsacas minuta]
MPMIIDSICAGSDISKEDSYHMMSRILNGSISEEEKIRLLRGLAAKGETDDEISGILRAMRDAATTVHIPDAIDVCGTGGDGLQTVNISTATVFVATSLGCRVAKHGNRSSSGGVGSADIFESIGCNLQAGPKEVASCMEKMNMCFMFAPRYHPSMKNIANARASIGKRTVFNLLGPLCNPACVKRQLIGVSSLDMLKRIPKILLKNGSEKIITVISDTGMDELSTAGSCHMLETDSKGQREHIISPKDLRLEECNISDLQVENKKALASFIKAIDGSASRAVCDTIALNAGAAMLVSGDCDNIKEGLEAALESIESGKAMKQLRSYVKYCGSLEILERICKDV